jgi:hypothetical protein
METNDYVIISFEEWVEQKDKFEPEESGKSCRKKYAKYANDPDWAFIKSNNPVYPPFCGPADGKKGVRYLITQPAKRYEKCPDLWDIFGRFF